MFWDFFWIELQTWLISTKRALGTAMNVRVTIQLRLRSSSLQHRILRTRWKINVEIVKKNFSPQEASKVFSELVFDVIGDKTYINRATKIIHRSFSNKLVWTPEHSELQYSYPERVTKHFKSLHRPNWFCRTNYDQNEKNQVIQNYQQTSFWSRSMLQVAFSPRLLTIMNCLFCVQFQFCSSKYQFNIA